MNFWNSLVLLICLASKAQVSVSEDTDVELQYKPPLPSFYMGFEFIELASIILKGSQNRVNTK